jgi:hypothetical protein
MTVVESRGHNDDGRSCRDLSLPIEACDDSFNRYASVNIVLIVHKQRRAHGMVLKWLRKLHGVRLTILQIPTRSPTKTYFWLICDPNPVLEAFTNLKIEPCLTEEFDSDPT